MIATFSKTNYRQACMRMRKLATSQSVVFCVPSDIACKIRAHRTDIFDQPISVSDVISWSITETLSDLRRNVALWGVQGRCHAKRKLIWDNARTDLSFNMSLVDAEKFLEQEALSLSERYVASGKTSEVTTDKSEDANSMDRIEDRLLHFGSNSLSAVALHEEQERELSPEVEQERQVERPKPASAERNFLHADVRSFVRTGELNEASEAFLSAFDILQQTSAAATYKALTFPKGVLVTKDFATTIRLRTTSDQMDSYQRPVQWVVTKSNPEGSKVENLLIISPYEAYQLLPAVRENLKVTLHIYSPCLTEENTCLDHLNLYTEGRIFQRINLLDPLLIQLNLFAGQLYFESYLSYSSTCSYLGLQWKLSEEEISVDGDGFIIDGARQGAFDQSPIEVLKVLACKIRRHGLDITRTHLGKMLGGIILDGTSFGLTGMRDLQGDVAEDHKSEKLDFIASR